MNSQTSQTQAGVDRRHGRSFAEKLTFASGHFLLVLLSAWLTFFNGLSHIGALFGKSWAMADPIRAKLIFAAIVLYFLRHMITLFVLLKRKIVWSEALGLLAYFAFFELGILLLGGGAFRNHSIPLNWLDILAGILIVIGSFINSFSELQRHWWKQDPSHKGKLYTEGLFHYAMHINYFGDVVLFTGWVLLTHNLWTLLLPISIALQFIYFHIPGLDSYLADHYGDAFQDYAKKTKKLFPFIY
jgi:protein-S-isoprenylcysteine O-methyltransferase Ste14